MPDFPNSPVSLALSPVICYRCGVVFAVPEAYASHRKQTTEPFFCPNGHDLTAENKPKFKKNDVVHHTTYGKGNVTEVLRGGRYEILCGRTTIVDAHENDLS